MSHRILSIAILAVFVISIAGTVGMATAQSNTTPPATTDTEQDHQVQEQYPSYKGSIAVPENTDDNGLASLAKITGEEAKAAAAANMSVSISDVQSASLENENGNLVYSVLVMKQGTVYDVKVDAGNGIVLFIDQSSDVGEGVEP